VCCWHSWSLEGGWLDRSRREIELSQRLNHAAILPVLECGGQKDWLWWIRPWVEGETLRSRLERGPVELAQGLDWLGQMAEGLASAHLQDICHQALQPDVIWLEQGRIRIADFGVTSPVNPVHVAGSGGSGPDWPDPIYCPPEWITGAPFTPQSDAYVLGSVAYFLFTGRALYSGDDMMQRLLKVLVEAPPLLTEVRPDAPDWLAVLVEALLSKAPGQRPSVSDVAWKLLHPPAAAVSLSSQQVEGLLAQLQEECTPVSRDSPFTLNPEQALKKLQSFQFSEEHAFALALVAAANALGCPRLEVTSGPLQWTLTYHGVQLRQAELENLWSYAFARQSGGLSHLALGLAAALAKPQARLSLDGGGWSFRIKSLAPPKLTRSRGQCLKVSVQASSGLTVARDWLVRRFGCSPTSIELDGRLLAPSIQPNRPALEVDAQIFPLFIGVSHAAEWLAVVDGLAYPLRDRVGPPMRVTVWGKLQTDLSYRHLVQNDTLRQLQQSVAQAVEQAIEEAALQASLADLEDERHCRHALKRWRQTDQSEKMEACYLRLLAQAGQVYSKEQPLAPLLREAWDYVHSLPVKPAEYWQICTRPVWASGADMATLEEIARQAFVNPLDGLLWRLEMWLGKRISDPSVEEIEGVVGAIWRHNVSPREGWDHRLCFLLREGILQNFSHQRLDDWLQRLPDSWLDSRCEIRRWKS
jgi:hypothetical protein